AGHCHLPAGAVLQFRRRRAARRPRSATEGSDPLTALTGLRVVDLKSGVAGAWCARLFSSFNADVVRVEAPDGSDALRRPGPFDPSTGNAETRPAHLYLNAGKRSLALDTEASEGRALLARLISRADVLVETLDGPARTRLDLEPATVRARHPS